MGGVLFAASLAELQRDEPKVGRLSQLFKGWVPVVPQLRSQQVSLVRCTAPQGAVAGLQPYRMQRAKASSFLYRFSCRQGNALLCALRHSLHEKEEAFELSC